MNPSEHHGIQAVNTSKKDPAGLLDSQRIIFCVSILVLNLVWIVYAIMSDVALENHFGKHNLWAHRSVVETFLVATALIVVPFIGVCGAARLARSTQQSSKVIGWLLLLLFAFSLFQAVMVACSEYGNWQTVGMS